jgi:hypothetical protein
MASKRAYLTQAELAEFADITITDTTEADDQITMAEEIIDAYVGAQDSFYKSTITNLASSGGASTLTLHTDHQNVYNNDYLAGCQIEIIGGTGSGQRRIISTQTKAGVVTVTEAWTTQPDSTSFYKIYQLGKFPRNQDVSFDSNLSADKYYKSIPEAVKRAVAAQVQYIIEMGDKFFATDDSGKQSESIGDYSYTNAEGSARHNRLIAPKAKMLLRGIKNIKGQIII